MISMQRLASVMAVVLVAVAAFALPVYTAHAAGTSTQAIPCQRLNLTMPLHSSNYGDTCYWSGGNATLYAGGGSSGYISYQVQGENDSIYYFAGSTTSWCPVAIATKYLPAQDYSIYVHTGGGGGHCPVANGSAVLYLSSTFAPPQGPAQTAQPVTALPVTVPPNSGGYQVTVQSNNGYSNSGASSGGTGSGAASGGATGLFILIMLVVGTQLFLRRRASRRKSSKFINHTAFGSSAGGPSAAPSMDPRLQALMARNPRFARMVANNRRLQQKLASGRGVFRSSRGYSITYTASNYRDTYDGM